MLWLNYNPSTSPLAQFLPDGVAVLGFVNEAALALQQELYFW